MPGFPIRTSADRGLVDGSPQLFAVTHVLHRFLAPRHPPLALRSLENTFDRSFELFVAGAGRSQTCDKMLVLALQFSRCDVAHAELALEVLGARRSGAGAEVVVADSLKTEEKTVSRRRPRRGEGPNPCDPRGLWPTAPPVHQLGVSRLHRTNADVQTRKHSLERR